MTWWFTVAKNQTSPKSSNKIWWYSWYKMYSNSNIHASISQHMWTHFTTKIQKSNKNTINCVYVWVWHSPYYMHYKWLPVIVSIFKWPIWNTPPTVLIKRQVWREVSCVSGTTPGLWDRDIENLNSFFAKMLSIVKNIYSNTSHDFQCYHEGCIY